MIDSHFGLAKMLTPAGQPSAVCAASQLSNKCRAQHFGWDIYKKARARRAFLYMAHPE